MRRTKAFTLIELMVVVSIIALLAMMLVPALQRALEMTRRANCLANLKGAGTDLAIYAQANDSTYPLLPGTGWDSNPDSSVITTTYTGVTADWKVGRSVSSLLFMLIRNGPNEGPKLFVCPSDTNAKADNTTNPSGVYNFDFSGGTTTRNLSYSYQCPIYAASGTPNPNGVPLNADSNLVVMADRTPQGGPNSDKPVTPGANAASSSTAAGAFNGNSSTVWASTVVSPSPYNSQNHTNGEMMNILYFDGHASQAKTPNCGPIVMANSNPDCIFTAFTTAAKAGSDVNDGIDYTGATTDNTQHTGAKDCYLWGGAGK